MVPPRLSPPRSPSTAQETIPLQCREFVRARSRALRRARCTPGRARECAWCSRRTVPGATTRLKSAPDATATWRAARRSVPRPRPRPRRPQTTAPWPAVHGRAREPAALLCVDVGLSQSSFHTLASPWASTSNELQWWPRRLPPAGAPSLGQCAASGPFSFVTWETQPRHVSAPACPLASAGACTPPSVCGACSRP